MRSFWRNRRRFFFVLCALLLLSGGVHAQRSYFTLYDQDYGLNVGEIAALAQDDAGFLWIGAHRGLLRFDGRNFVPWAPDKLDEVVYQLLHGPGDVLLVRAASGRGWQRTAEGLQPLAGPDGNQIVSLDSFDFDRDGRLWAVISGVLWRRDDAAQWRRIDHRIPGTEKVMRVFAVGEAVVVLTDAAAWRIDDQAARELLRAPDLWFATRDSGDGIWIAAHFSAGLWRIDASGAHAIERPGGRALDLRLRGKSVWLSLDRQLVEYDGTGAPRSITTADGLPSGGPLLVDHENSLWLGTFVGLLQFPQPDTWQWGESDGLPSEHAYAIVEHEGSVFASTWSGLAHWKTGAKFVLDFPPFGGVVCSDIPQGVLTSDGKHLMRWNGDRFESIADWPKPRVISACLANGDDVLMATSTGLSRFSMHDRTLHDLASSEGIDQIWRDASGDIYAAKGERVCRVTIEAANSVMDSCVAFPALARANTVAQISAHETWISANDGVFGFDGEHIKRLSGNRLIEGGVASTLAPSRDGDWWLSGSGVLLRVHPCGGCEGNWLVREAPGRWQGLPGNSAIAVSENERGDLWIAGNRGIWRVPHDAREGPQRMPTVVPVRVSIDGADQRFGQALEIKPDAHRIELEFAALSYRDRSLLRFRSRLHENGEWSAPTRSPILQFAALEPDDYHAEMAASLDGDHWSATAASVQFRVLPPWYRTVWARAMFFFAIVCVAAWLYRLRVAALLRVERERTRIAMDLHDELGSGLGSIGMLAGVAARDDVDSNEARKLVREIADLSGLLGSGLRSLVWSLRSGRAGVAELGTQIADHARRLFPGDQPQLSVRLPAAPSNAPIAPELRRHVLLFALEALHNTARHAHAKHVALALDSDGGDNLTLTIEDDGRGFEAGEKTGGTGLESMRRRADAIGARMNVDTQCGRGTRIVLVRAAQTA